MKHEVSYTKTFSVSTEDIINALCCAEDIGYWGEICFDDSIYEAAKQRLAEAATKKDTQAICYEEVLAEVLEHGDKLKIWDREEDEYHELNLEQLLSGIAMNASERGEHDPDDWDGDSGDCIIQYAIFKEVVYG
jgi:hypothetical protein